MLKRLHDFASRVLPVFNAARVVYGLIAGGSLGTAIAWLQQLPTELQVVLAVGGSVVGGILGGSAPDIIERIRGRRPSLKFVRLEWANEVQSNLTTMQKLDRTRLWRVRLENTAPGTEASRVEVRLDDCWPHVQDFHMVLHEKDDWECRQARDMQFGKPVWIDTLARSVRRGTGTLYVYRSDLPGRSGYIYSFPGDRTDVIQSALTSPDGFMVKLLAVADKDTKPAVQWCRFSLDSDGALQAEFCNPPEPRRLMAGHSS